ncbi:MAG TPA: hypothetical protein VF178_11080 [Gemmatimonadaceae bacterium]
MATKPVAAAALAGPVYAMAAILVTISILDFLQSVSGFQPGSIQWRFATVGLLSSYLVMPMLGSLITIVVAAVNEHRAVQRIMGIVNVVAAVALLVLLMGFALDVLQLRNSVPSENVDAFTAASLRAGAKHGLAVIGLAYLGWRAMRGVAEPATQRQTRGVVPLITK